MSEFNCNSQTIYTRTALYHNSFLPSTIRDWNNLKQDRLVMLIPSNKRERVPKYFYNGSRRGQMLHTRLRTKCSSLNKDLFDKKIVVSPQCQCRRIESTYHYFLECPIYANRRLELFTSLSQHINVTLNLILSGDTLLSNDINSIIFEKVQKYIIDTKRFDS